MRRLPSDAWRAGRWGLYAVVLTIRGGLERRWAKGRVLVGRSRELVLDLVMTTLPCLPTTSIASSARTSLTRPHRMRPPIALARLASPAPLRLLRAVSSMPPRYPGHIPLTMLEKVVLTAGSATAALLDPRRAGAPSW
jgi:hypothetical protein